MTCLVAIDPGKTPGWALFRKKALVRCGRKGLLEALVGLDDVKAAVIEKPVAYPQDKTRVNDLITLAINVGEWKAFCEDRGMVVELVEPRRWKGSVPKAIHNQRVLGALTEEELKLLPKRPRAKDYDHNMVDAVGLGLWKLGRRVQ